MAICEFCKMDIERGTGKKFIFKDGKIISLCSSKCEKNLFKLKRKARTTRWTNEFYKLKHASGKAPSEEPRKDVKKAKKGSA